MPVVWKDIFRPGTYPDYAGELFTFTDSHVIQAYHNGRGMLKAKIPFPVPGVWEHDWAAVPMPRSSFLSLVVPDRDKRADFARNTFGWVDDYDLKYEPDKKQGGKEVPVLWALVNTPDARDREQLVKSRYCSPRVDFDFKDTMRRRWDGCSVVHLAATSQPVQIDQAPFMLGEQPSRRTFFLGANMADDADKGKGGDGGETGAIRRIKAALAKMGRPIPDSVNSLDEMALAVETLAMGSDDGTTEPPPDESDAGAGDVGGSGISPAMLSALPPAERAAYEVVQKNSRNGLLKRFKAVEGTAAEKGLYKLADLKDLESRLSRMNLSFGATADLNPNPAIRELQGLERLVRNAGGGKSKTGEPNIGPADLSGLGGGVGNEPVPGGPGWDEHVKKAAEAAANRVAPLPKK